MDQILDRLKRAKFAIVGFGSFKYENFIRDLMMKALDNPILIEYQSIEKLMNWLKSDRFKRDMKLKGLLGAEKITLVVDINSIESPKNIREGVSLYTQRKEIIYKLWEFIYKIDEQRYLGNKSIPSINLVILSFVRKNIKVSSDSIPIILKHSSDLIMVFSDDTIHVLKDKDEGCKNIPFTHKSIMRHLKLNKLLDE